jgi:hypothetical protein
MAGVDSIREVLSRDLIWLDKLEGNTGIFDHVEAFVNLSRGNDSVWQAVLHPFTDPGEDASGTYRYAIWDKIAEGIGNLQALRAIPILWMTEGIRLPLTGRFWLASCDVFDGISI